MLSLPNGCHISEMRIAPANQDIKKNWVIYYSFYDPGYPKPKLRQLRGMNHLKTLSERRKKCKELMEWELKYLMSGFNPFEKQINRGISEVTEDTPFVMALNKALEKINVEPETLTDIKSVIKGTTIAARKLGFESKAVSHITRKYFKSIFEKCKEMNPKFSANRQNVYRKWLKRLFDELIEMEAVESNPLVSIRKEKTTKKERVLPTEEQRREINEFLKEKYYPFWRTMQIFFTSDSRQRELFRVQAKHVNLEDQSCLYLVKKGKEERWVRRPIIDAALFLWEEILSECKSEEDFLFSDGLVPGNKQISSSQFGRRWQRHVKGTCKPRIKPNSRKKHYKPVPKLNIDIDLNSLRHTSITELMDRLDKEYNPANDVKKISGHTTEKMIAKVYDMNNQNRKDDKVKKAGGLF